MAHPCQLCQTPTEARTCLTCVGAFERLLDQATAVLPELTTEATGTAKKTPGGWSTGSEGVPLGIRLAPLQASNDITQAVRALAAHIGVERKTPHTLKPEVYKLAWPAADRADIKTIYTDLTLAVRTAVRLVDTQPELILFGWCPACGEHAKAPADRTYQVCRCGQGLDLIALKEKRGDMIHDKLDGAWFTAKVLSAALAGWGYKVSANQVNMWAERGKFERERVNGKWVYPFDEALHQAELKEIRRRQRVKKKALDQAA